MYEMPLSVPESHGYKSISIDGSHEQSFRHRSSPLTPTTQSGDGPNIDTSETLLCFRSTLKNEEVFVLTWGYHKPPAFISVLRRPPFARSSSSNALGEPLWCSVKEIINKLNNNLNFKIYHSAKERKPSVAIWFSPQNENFASCVAPTISEKWVNHSAKG